MARMSRRPHMPLSVKLASALHALGLDPTSTQFDHNPSLEMRPFDKDTEKYTPDANDYRFIVPMGVAAHKKKTFGDHVPLSGDVSIIAKLKRNVEAEAEFRAKILAKEPCAPRTKRSKIPSRPFRRERRKRP